MGQIRKQSIISSLFTYLGFLVGIINTYFFVRDGHFFTPSQYGLTRLFTDVAQIMLGFASLGTTTILYKFSPYYYDRLRAKENDLLTWCLIAVSCGFILVCLAGYLFEPLVIRKYSERSDLFVFYYKWTFLFGLGLVFFSVLEAYTYTLKQAIVPNMLRELGFRLMLSVVMVPYCLHWCSFDTFIKLYAFLYIALALSLLFYLVRRGQFHLTLKSSRVTHKFRKKMLSLISLTYGGVLIQMLAISVDSIIIAQKQGMRETGVYSLSLYIANIVQIPQRSVQTVTIPVLSQAWKDKDMRMIDKIYHRTSLNLLIISSILFSLIWLNTVDAFTVLHLNPEYLNGLMVIFILGISRVVDAGTGVNAQIIGTSTFWRFEFVSGMVLLGLRIPLNYILIGKYGITGSAVADLISLIVYNLLRMVFLMRKFKLQPFNFKSLLAFLFAIAAYFIVYWSCRDIHGWLAMILRCAFYSVLYGVLIFLFKLTPDADQLLQVALNKLPGRKKRQA